MEHNEFVYEVIFALRPAKAEAKRHFHWFWIRLRRDGEVVARGELCTTLQAAMHGAVKHRKHHGGGEIRVNIHESPHVATTLPAKD